MATTATASKEGKAKAKRATSASKKSRAYPPYSEMISEAITALKERTGSSQIAIAKFIEEKQKDNLPSNFKKLLLVQLKKLVANGKLVKVKNSFKLPPKAPSTTTAAAKKPVSDTAKAAAKKPKASNPSAAAKKPKSAPAKAGDKKPKPKAKEGALKSPKKKAVVVAKAKKPKTIKSPAKKVAVKKGKK